MHRIVRSAVVAALPLTAVLLAAPAHPLGAATSASAATLPLRGKVVTLDPGHNGGNAAHPGIINDLVYAGNGLYKPCNTVGTEARSGYDEHRLNWDVATRVATLLRDRGARVVMTRSSNTGVGPCINIRPRIGNDAQSNAVVSIHADGSYTSRARGFHIIYPSASTTPAAVRQVSVVLAKYLRSSYASATGLPYANYVAGGDALQGRGDLGGLNLTRRPTVFIEMGNMKSSSDYSMMDDADARQRLARGIANGISRFLTR